MLLGLPSSQKHWSWTCPALDAQSINATSWTLVKLLGPLGFKVPCLEFGGTTFGRRNRIFLQTKPWAAGEVSCILRRISRLRCSLGNQTWLTLPNVYVASLWSSSNLVLVQKELTKKCGIGHRGLGCFFCPWTQMGAKFGWLHPGYDVASHTLQPYSQVKNGSLWS